MWSHRPPVSWIIAWMCCDHEDRIGVELAYKTGPLHYLYRQFAIAQCQWNCSVCRLQEILFPVEVGDKSSSLEVLLQKNWFRYDIWLLKNSKRLKHKTKPSGNSRKQKLQNSIQLRKQVSQIVSSSVSEYDWLNNQITSVAREHKKDSMGEEKNKTRKKKKIVVRNQEMIYPPLISNNTFKKVLKFYCKLPRSIKSTIPYQWR